MPEPVDMIEYERLFQQRTSIEGMGLETSISMPCPFCAAPAFMRYRVLEVETAMQAGSTCKACGRSARAIMQRSSSGVSFEVVQTGGPDQPQWLERQMRRVDE